jgi:HlyD family secretion protein
LDKAKLDADTNAAALASAKAQLDIKRSEEAAATARLIDPTSVSEQPATDCCVRIRAPVSGRVLSIIQDSEASVPASAPLIEIGDPRDLEVVAELLSTDAVQISIGARVKIDGWGGEPLQGRVKRVDPAGFLKVSALGIEEQRVRTVIDLIDSADVWSRLGHDFRVVVHVNIWSAEKVLTIPTGALFRAGDDWAVFVQKGGRARSRPVQVGHRNDRRAEILGGLSEGDQVVLHPSDRIADGTKVAQRQID